MPKFIPRGQVSAKALNQQAELGRRTEQFKSGGIARATYGPTGQQLYVPPPPGFWAKLTSKDTGGARIAYAWTHYVDDGDGTWSAAASALAGTTSLLQAYESTNQNVTISSDTDEPTIVWLMPSAVANTFLFEIGGGGSTARHCIVAHAAVTSGTIEYYPSTFRILDPSTDTFDSGPQGDGTYDCFLVQDKDYALTVTSSYGAGCYLGLKQATEKTLTVDAVSTTLPVYVTTESPFLGPDCIVRN